MKRGFSFWGVFLLLLAPAQSQDVSDAELGESAQAVRQLRAVRDKTLVFVFDVSGSMRGQNLGRAREATINLLREATQPGDRAVLFTFGAGYRKVFDEVIDSEAEKQDLIEQVPSEVGSGAGTNIRRPDHDALKILDKNLPKPGAVVLFTDSFNDEPRRTDAAYKDYLKYYFPGGQLQKYPDTPENRDYERLLRKVQSSQKVKIYGIGVQIDQSGRPVERLPQTAPEPTEVVPEVVETAPEPVKKPSVPWLPLGLGALALAAAAFVLPGLFRKTAVRLSGAGGPKDFVLPNNGAVRLGGEGADFASDAFAITGTKNAVAQLRVRRGGLELAPVPGAEPAQVYHNGLLLEKTVPANFGDEIRISVPDAGGFRKDVRLRIEDPKQSF